MTQMDTDEKKGEIILYQPNNDIRLEVRIAEETVWLSQAQMAVLFQTTPQNVTIHIRNLYKEGELDKVSTCKDYLQVQKEGGRIVRRKQKQYNLKRGLSGVPFYTFSTDIADKAHNVL